MSRNPYSPPASAVPEGPKEEAVRRPISVWILLLFLLASITLYCWGFIRGAQFVMAVRTGAISPITAAWMLAWRVGVFALLVLAVAGVYRQHWAGRWFGLAVIAGVAMFSIFGHDTTQYANDAERAGGFMGRVIVFPALFAWWAHAYAFSAKAKRYFLPRSARAAA
jgi:hypothetical protein